MAARPRKPSKIERSAAQRNADLNKPLPESLIPVRRPELKEFTLPYEKLAIRLGWEIQQLDGCMIDAAAALYVVFAGVCEHAGGLPPALVFHDLNSMAERGELKGYMEEHGKVCPHTPPNR